VKELERQVLEYKNRSFPPRLSKDEAEAQKGMNEAERVARTQKELEAPARSSRSSRAGRRARYLTGLGFVPLTRSLPLL